MKDREYLKGCFTFIAIPLLAFLFVGLVCWMSYIIGVEPMKYIDLAVVIASLIIVMCNSGANPEDGWDFVWFITGNILLAGSVTSAIMLGEMSN